MSFLGGSNCLSTGQSLDYRSARYRKWDASQGCEHGLRFDMYTMGTCMCERMVQWRDRGRATMGWWTRMRLQMTSPKRALQRRSGNVRQGDRATRSIISPCVQRNQTIARRRCVKHWKHSKGPSLGVTWCSMTGRTECLGSRVTRAVRSFGCNRRLRSHRCQRVERKPVRMWGVPA